MYWELDILPIQKIITYSQSWLTDGQNSTLHSWHLKTQIIFPWDQNKWNLIGPDSIRHSESTYMQVSWPSEQNVPFLLLFGRNKSSKWTETSAAHQAAWIIWDVFQRLWKETSQHNYTSQHRACLLEYYLRPQFAASFLKSWTLRSLISYFFYFNNKYSLSLYVYPRGMLGCLLGFWPLVQNPAGAITV